MEGVSVTAGSKKTSRCRSFHFRYLELCRAKNYPTLSDIKAKHNATANLDFFADKLKTDDWLLIIESLHYDQILQNLAIRMRKIYGNVAEQIDSEKKAKVFKHKPAIYSKFVFSGVVEAISNCIKFNKNLTTLCLEALPFNEKYVVSIAKAFSTNENIKSVSFHKSPIGDKGCEAICSTIKYMANIEDLNMAQCNLTVEGATYIADMIKFQKIFRYSEGWKKSLRYRDVDPDSIPGLRAINLSHNPGIGDKGVNMITEILKEDVWIKFIGMEDCGLTDVGANAIIDCLEINKQIIEFNVRGNTEVSKFLLRNIRLQLGKEDEQGRDDDANPKKSKVSISQIKDRNKFLEEQIASEKYLRKQVELLNEQLHAQIMAYEKQISQQGSESPARSDDSYQVPEGCTVIKDEALEKLIKERDEYKEIVAALKGPPAVVAKGRSMSKKVTAKVRKCKSETKYVEDGSSRKKMTRSDIHFDDTKKNSGRDVNSPSANMYIETNIGDTGDLCQRTSRADKNGNKPREENLSSTSLISAKTFTEDEYSEESDISTPKQCTFRGGIEEAFRIFVRKKQPNASDRSSPKSNRETYLSPRSLFMGVKKN